jgi:tripartite ATP-independent transporter DctM subunit
MALTAMVAFTYADNGIFVVANAVYTLSTKSLFVTIPLFTFAGYMMAESKSPQRMLKFAQASLGWLPGGVAIVSLVVCAFFTAFTGASGVTIIALGGLLYPILTHEGYEDKFTLGLITTSGSLGLLFPPSLPIILYGIIANVDIDKIFKAGIFPGILVIVALTAFSMIKGKKTGYVEHDEDVTSDKGEKIKISHHFIWKDFIESFKGCFWEILLPIGVLVGIYGGFTTVSEAAAFTAFYVLVMECFIYKDLNFIKDIPETIKGAMTLVGAILLILCCAFGLTDYLVDEEIPMQLFEFIKPYIENKLVFFIFLNIFLLLVGAMMDIFSAIIVVVPLILPIAKIYDVDSVHLAIIFLTNLSIGYITPPVGINLFISSFRFKKPITEVYKASFPFLLLMLACLLVVTYVPALSLWYK